MIGVESSLLTRLIAPFLAALIPTEGVLAPKSWSKALKTLSKYTSKKSMWHATLMCIHWQQSGRIEKPLPPFLLNSIESVASLGERLQRGKEIVCVCACVYVCLGGGGVGRTAKLERRVAFKKFLKTLALGCFQNSAGLSRWIGKPSLEKFKYIR